MVAVRNLDIRVALAAFSAALAERPKNSDAWTYTIFGFDGSPYITRTLLPRLGGLRPMIHRIHREDADEHMHNHPWSTAQFMIMSGGYTEDRLVNGEVQRTALMPGDVNTLTANTFHRVVDVIDGTWTFGLVGDRCQDWGFLVDGVVVPSAEYFKRKGYVSAGGGQP